MITTPRASVRPEQELARLTLISSTNEAEIRRRSTISGIRPFGLGDINGDPVAGPLGPPELPQLNETEIEMKTNEPTPTEEPSDSLNTSDIDSETTLISETRSADDEQTEPTASISNEQAETQKLQDTSAQLMTSQTPELPSRMPPEPPRHAEEARKRQLKEEVELGAQQDVTEVINNVLFQSECAIKPRGIAPDGEQLDQIKE